MRCGHSAQTSKSNVESYVICIQCSLAGGCGGGWQGARVARTGLLKGGCNHGKCQAYHVNVPCRYKSKDAIPVWVYDGMVFGGNGSALVGPEYTACYHRHRCRQGPLRLCRSTRTPLLSKLLFRVVGRLRRTWRRWQAFVHGRWLSATICSCCGSSRYAASIHTPAEREDTAKYDGTPGSCVHNTMVMSNEMAVAEGINCIFE